jgi:signal peptidase II
MKKSNRDYMKSWPLFLGPLFLALLVIVLDQWSKVEILRLFSEPRGVLTITPFFNLVLVFNKGVSFGLFNNTHVMSDFFALVATAVTVALILWLSRVKEALSAVALGLLIGGAVGNIIDRLRIGAVVDFLDFHVYDWHWPAFNVADSAVVVGVALLLLQSLVFDKKNGHS